MIDVMVDLETLDTKPTATIVSVGAVKFNREGIIDKFYKVVDIQSCIDAGFTVSGDTLKWWLSQRGAANVFKDGTVHIATALFAFNDWVGSNEDIVLWGNGAAFDNAILSNAYSTLRIQQPWKFWNDRCYRTIAALSDHRRVQKGTHHNALDDAISQAEHLIEIYPACLQF